MHTLHEYSYHVHVYISQIMQIVVQEPVYVLLIVWILSHQV